MLLATVAAASKQLAETPSRKGKTLILATLLSALSTAEITPVVSWLSGELTQRQIGVGWASLRQLPQPSERPTLTVEQTESAFTAIGTLRGPGSRTRREELLRSLFEQADELETRFLRALLGGELRQGALKAQMLDAIATAAAIDIATVRRAAMLLGDTAHVAALALAGDVTALHNVRLHVGRPVAPMLASPGSSVSQALETPGEYAFERKLDGARIQVHRDGEQVTVFTRTLDDVTARLGEIVAAVRALPVTSIVLDGEAMALRTDGRPAPFQVTASRFGSRNSSEPSLSAFYFDLLHLDGVDLIDTPASQRFALLDKVIPQDQRVQRIITDQVAEAQEFLDSALADGYEGVVVKSLHAGYDAGRRGAAWRKIKPVHSLDLVVLAVEHGSGRRRGTLSNIHLGARDGATGEFVMLGKTFKGMTDEMLVWQTQRFTELATGPTDGWVVPLRAEQVVEIAFDSVQRSSRYPAGVTLRFARVLRYRDDKPAADIDTVQSVQAMLPQ